MAPVQLKGGFYQARSLIANAQRCYNLYPEKNPEDSPSPYIMYSTPGLYLRGQGPEVAGWRGLYLATNGYLYGVCGRTFCLIYPSWAIVPLGTLYENRSTPVSMKDNGEFLVCVDGSRYGYTVNLTTQQFSYYSGVSPNFQGADRVDYLDTFLLFNVPGTRQWYCTLSNTLEIDPTYVASKTVQPDKLATLAVIHREIWLLGDLFGTEIWFNAGGAAFPFASTAGVYVDHGIAAKYSLVKHGSALYWLVIDQDGLATVVRGENYKVAKISTPAIAAKISTYATITDAVGMIYKQQDHIFYVLTFPSADKTWVYDITEGLWHERGWNDEDGNEHRWRPNCLISAYGKIVAGDFEDGRLYTVELGVFTDDGDRIVRRRGFPHLINDGLRVTYDNLDLDIEVAATLTTIINGTYMVRPWTDEFGPEFGPVTYVTGPPLVSLRWSDTRGVTWGNPVTQSLGATGEYLTQPSWNNLGYARDRVFEVFWDFPMPVSLQGAWLTFTPAET